MNSYYTLKLLTQELRSKLLNARFIESTTPLRQTWSGIFSADKLIIQLQFNTTADRISLFFRSIKNEDSEIRKRKNRLTFFDDLNGVKLIDIALAEKDRLLFFTFENGDVLRFVLFGPVANLLHLNREGKVLDAFRRTDLDQLGIQDELSGVKTKLSRPNSAESDATNRNGSEGAKKTKKTGNSAVERGVNVKNWILAENPKLSRPLLNRLLSKDAPLWILRPDIVEEHAARELAREMTQFIEETPEPRVLQNGICSLVPSSWISHEPVFDCESANEMIRKAFLSIPGKDSFLAQKQSQIQKVEGLIRKREDSLKQLSDEKKTLSRAEKNERFGHLLLAHSHLRIPSGQVYLELENLFKAPEEAPMIRIPVNPTRSIPQNAQEYYEKSEKGRRSIQALQVRRKQLNESIELLNFARTELRSVSDRRSFDKWLQKYGKQVQTITPSLPYREIEVQGWKIWIGKHSKGNEQMLSLAHKEDLWMHARGVPGSHVIVRMGGKRDNPPSDLEDIAASYAAWFSKARGSQVVPVIVTRRKFITKPRKSPPGVVQVLKENVRMVPPVCPPQSTYIEESEV